MEDEPVIEEERGTDKAFLRQLYNSVAEVHPVVQEVLDGYTTFSEALEEIVDDLRSGEFSALDDFTDYFAAMVKIAECPVLVGDEKEDMVKFHDNYSDRWRKRRKNFDLVFGGGSIAVGGAGEYLIRTNPKYQQLGIILKSLGIGGLASATGGRLTYLLGGWRQGKKFDKVVNILKDEAHILDVEVIDAFYSYIDTVRIGEDDVEIKWAETDEEFEQYKAVVESKGNMDMSSLDELHPDDGEHLLVLAKAGDEVIGGAGLVEQWDRLYLDSFIVAEEWRNRGVGTAMVDEIHEHCLPQGHTLAAIVATYVGVNKKKFIGMGFNLLLKKDALEQGLLYKDDEYAMRPKNKGCSLFLRPKPFAYLLLPQQ